MGLFLSGLFVGSLATVILMAILKSGSDYDDLTLGDKQYEE